MTKILDLDVRWNFEWGNEPDLLVDVDRYPPLNEFRYERRENAWYADIDGIVQFFACDPDKGNNGGYYGRKFELTMLDGSKQTLIGPWSSNSSHMNSLGFGPCIEASIKAPDDTLRYAGAVNVNTIRRAQARLSKWDFSLVRYSHYGDPDEVEFTLIWNDLLGSCRDKCILYPLSAKVSSNGRCETCGHKVLFHDLERDIWYPISLLKHGKLSFLGLNQRN